jgi:hypothetical protein
MKPTKREEEEDEQAGSDRHPLPARGCKDCWDRRRYRRCGCESASENQSVGGPEKGERQREGTNGVCAHRDGDSKSFTDALCGRGDQHRIERKVKKANAPPCRAEQPKEQRSRRNRASKYL